MNEGRTGKAIKNSEYAILSKILETVLAFILRTVFIRCLSTVYLGLNGIFTNVLQVLSLMELGLGSAIAFSLYKPLADNNRPKIVALMDLYRKFYRNIGIIICAAGFCLTPFLKFIITLPEEVPHIYIIYWLNMGNTAITYFVAYKRTLLIADQRLYINYQNNIIFKFTRFFILSGILIFTHNFILYLALDILNTFISNIVISLKVNKMYPYLMEYKDVSLEKEEVRKNMEKSQIFLMTSDRQEGWGAVLNEAMNSACAVIANKAAGAVPYLIRNDENGFAYTKCDIDDICEKIIELFNDEEKMKSVQEQAYYTISNEWNAKVAAERLIKLSNVILNGERSPDLFEDGICSKG